MGLQISRGLDSQVPQEDAVGGAAEASCGGIPEIGGAEGMPDRGGTSAAGSRAYDDIDPAEICGVAGGGLHQGQECHPRGAGLRRTQAQFRGPALLGQRVLRLHRAPKSRIPPNRQRGCRRQGISFLARRNSADSPFRGCRNSFWGRNNSPAVRGSA